MPLQIFVAFKDGPICSRAKCARTPIRSERTSFLWSIRALNLLLQTSSGLPHASKGPNWADKWTRGEAWTALQYITSTSRQYAASVTSICKTVEELTKDDILVADLKKELLASLVTDKKTLKTQLDKPIGKAGVVFKEEDMPPAPKV